jgi:hypothetical protein
MSGPMDSGSHQIFVWDMAAQGQFLKTIENGKEPLIDMDVRLNPSRQITFWKFLTANARSGTHTFGKC